MQSTVCAVGHISQHPQRAIGLHHCEIHLPIGVEVGRRQSHRCLQTLGSRGRIECPQPLVPIHCSACHQLAHRAVLQVSENERCPCTWWSFGALETTFMVVDKK